MAERWGEDADGEVVVNFTRDEEGRPALVFKDLDVLFICLAEDADGKRQRRAILHNIALALKDRLIEFESGK